jgi:putative ATP-dependent endonuclease of OLD family
LSDNTIHAIVQDQDVETPSLILAIEEPELYQHPTKQRHFASVLRKLSEGRIPGIRGRVQVIFASHSPTFISMPNVSEIRFTRRSGNVGDPLRSCEISALNLEAVAEKLGIACQAAPGRFTAAALQPRLHILGPELSEGFFADGIVLVEGPSDRAALMAAANQLGVDFEESGIAIVAAGGKNNIDRPYLIYRELKIEVYLVWDCDCRKGEGAAANLRILRSIHPNDDHRVAPTTTQISDDFACFQDDLETELKNSLTAEVYDQALSEVCETHEAVRDDAKKNPEIVRQMLARSRELGQEPVILHDIVRAAWRKLKRENI